MRRFFKWNDHYSISCISLTNRLYTVHTGCLQKNGAVSKVNEKFISHLTRAQRTPSAAAAVQVSHVLPAVRFSCLLRSRGASFQDGVVAGKGLLCVPFWGVQFCGHASKRSTQKAFSCCDVILESGPAAPQKRTAVSAWETWTVAAADGVRCARVRWEINFSLTFENAPFFVYTL